MDALSPRHPAQRVVFMKGSQLGASESGCNWIGYRFLRLDTPVDGVASPAGTIHLPRGVDAEWVTFRVDDGGLVRLERAVSTYVTNAYGVADPSWRDLETKKTVAWIRYQRRARVATKFPRHKLASDGTRAGAGQALVTPKIIRADGIAQFRQWEEVGIVANVDSWIDRYIVERDATDPNRVNELLPADVVNQLRVFAGRVQFVL